ncbi:5-amino-6-(5-phosphoribosylamino)uracil reductase homolog [Halorhodospira halochloris]|uniref:5-amino-6-(5-phosphoribosylamino)uracil reductase homolog n=1 Tax=Halorhodospira halochloris TaxID=1052 RepID=A0A110B5H4_HALHR|nr:dihydrofolate reductase family protein [Halorhodospira halochloris]BAU58301.1 5-amino-6-(5-phosphoribosylamino)uracil reductase homolog [Halorhodospira halochloris]
MAYTPINTGDVIELDQAKCTSHPLKDLYIDKIPPPAVDQQIWCYMSFITSLDGRISLDFGKGACRVPPHLANPRDWRLFQELAAHSDCLVTTSRYLRDLQAGTAQAPLPVDVAYQDLIYWRLDNGLNKQPDVAVIGSSSDFTLPAEWFDQGRLVWLFAPSNTEADNLRRHHSLGAQVAAYFTGNRAGGKTITSTLSRLGYRRVFFIGGPQLSHSLLADDALDTLFLTIRQRIIGGQQGSYESIVEGPALELGLDFELRWIFLDTAAGNEAGQLFTRYDRIRHSV